MNGKTMAIILILVNLLLAAAVLVAGVTAEAVQPKPATVTCQWATITQSCMMHEGPGLRYRMTGRITTGRGVEVIGEKDGWYKCWFWPGVDPAWISGEYVALND